MKKLTRFNLVVQILIILTALYINTVKFNGYASLKTRIIIYALIVFYALAIGLLFYKDSELFNQKHVSICFVLLLGALFASSLRTYYLDENDIQKIFEESEYGNQTIIGIDQTYEGDNSKHLVFAYENNTVYVYSYNKRTLTDIYTVSDYTITSIEDNSFMKNKLFIAESVGEFVFKGSENNQEYLYYIVAYPDGQFSYDHILLEDSVENILSNIASYNSDDKFIDAFEIENEDYIGCVLLETIYEQKEYNKVYHIVRVDCYDDNYQLARSSSFYLNGEYNQYEEELSVTSDSYITYENGYTLIHLFDSNHQEIVLKNNIYDSKDIEYIKQ